MNFHSDGNPRNLDLDSHAVRIATEYLDVFYNHIRLHIRLHTRHIITPATFLNKIVAGSRGPSMLALSPREAIFDQHQLRIRGCRLETSFWRRESQG